MKMHRVKNVQNNIFTILVMYTFALQPIIGAKENKNTPQKFTPLNIFKLNVVHNLLLYRYVTDAKFC